MELGRSRLSRRVDRLGKGDVNVNGFFGRASMVAEAESVFTRHRRDNKKVRVSGFLFGLELLIVGAEDDIVNFVAMLVSFGFMNL